MPVFEALSIFQTGKSHLAGVLDESDVVRYAHTSISCDVNPVFHSSSFVCSLLALLLWKILSRNFYKKKLSTKPMSLKMSSGEWVPTAPSPCSLKWVSSFYYRQIMVNRVRRQSSFISAEEPPSPKTAARLQRQATANAQHLTLSSSMPAAARHVDDVSDNSGDDGDGDGDSVFLLSPPATERTRLLAKKPTHRSSKA